MTARELVSRVAEILDTDEANARSIVQRVQKWRDPQRTPQA